MSEPADYYATGNAWNKVETGVQHCAPVRHHHPDFVFVIYPDVEESCDEPHELGAGGEGLTILHRGDLEGVANPGLYFYCDEGPYEGTLGRWTGGLGHELGHAFGLPHPPGCDQEDHVVCDDLEINALMHLGYTTYPETYLLTTDKEILMRSHFINLHLERLTGPPATLGLAPFYKKYLDADGIPIVSSSRVPDRVLFTARDIMDEMLALRGDLRAAIAAQEVIVAIMAQGSALSDLPEFRDIGDYEPGVSWDERTKGGGVGPTDARPVVAIAEENLLCYGGEDVFPYEDIFIHEFGHAVLNMGIERLPGGEEFRERLNQTYSKALETGLWVNTYAATNPDEYWAEGVQSWFGLNDPPGEIHNEINTRGELEAYDPVLARLIREVFGDVTVSASCHETIDIKKRLRIQGVVIGPDGKPLEGIGLWAWQGEADNSGYGETGADDVFEIEVPNGTFTLDVYAGSAECNFVGWYDGAGSIATSDSEAAKIVVNGANIEGIEIRLPERPDQLTPIAWCAP